MATFNREIGRLHVTYNGDLAVNRVASLEVRMGWGPGAANIEFYMSIKEVRDLGHLLKQVLAASDDRTVIPPLS